MGISFNYIFNTTSELNFNFTNNYLAYNGIPLEIVSQFKYLGIVFTPGGSFSEAQTTLAGQAQKAIFKLNKYLYKFTYITPKHKLELFDKLITPILNYSSAVWGFSHANVIERVHLQFCKKVLGVKKNAQNDFVYGELGRTTLITKRYYDIVKYWFKVLASPDHKYIHIIYNLMLHDILSYHKIMVNCSDFFYNLAFLTFKFHNYINN